MTTNQSIMISEWKHFCDAVAYINSMFGTTITMEKKDEQNGIALVTIHSTHVQAFFALAIEFGRRLEQSKFREYIKIMMEEIKD